MMAHQLIAIRPDDSMLIAWSDSPNTLKALAAWNGSSFAAVTAMPNDENGLPVLTDRVTQAFAQRNRA